MQIINNTGSNFVIRGITISNGATYTITTGQERLFAADQTLWAGLSDPTLAVSDGTNSFISDQGQEYLYRLLTNNYLDTYPSAQNITARDIASSSASGQNSQSIITGTPTAASTANFPYSSFSSGIVQITGTWTGTLQPEISLDSGTTWYPIKLSQPAINSSVATFTANLSGVVNIAGTTNFRIRSTAAMTGTAVVTLILSYDAYSAYVTNDVVGTVGISASQTIGISAGSAVIGHVIADSGSTTAVTGNVASTVADGANVTLGAKADAKSTATDTTAISIMSVLKQISASAQAPPSQAVTNAGTFATQSTLAAETTKVIGTVNIAASQTIGLAAGAATIGALTANQSVNIAQVNGGTTVASVTGVQDVMPRKRTGATGLSPNYAANRITSKTTTTITASTAYLSAMVVSCTGAGTSWTFVVQNKEGTPKILFPSITLTVPTTGPLIFQFAEPILMTTGIDIVTAGTTAGTVDVFMTYWQ